MFGGLVCLVVVLCFLSPLKRLRAICGSLEITECLYLFIHAQCMLKENFCKSVVKVCSNHFKEKKIHSACVHRNAHVCAQIYNH